MRTEASKASPFQWMAWAAMAGGLFLLIAGVPALFDFINHAYSVRMETAILALAEATAGVGLAVAGSLLIAGALVGLSVGSRGQRSEE